MSFFRRKPESTPTHLHFGAIHWLRHRGSWFGFPRPAHFDFDRQGGFFADATGTQIFSIRQLGYRQPTKGDN